MNRREFLRSFWITPLAFVTLPRNKNTKKYVQLYDKPPKYGDMITSEGFTEISEVIGDKWV